MIQDLNTRMVYIRACLSDPRLTNRQQKCLAAIATFMPFDTDEGWIIKTSEVAQSMYFGKEPLEGHKRLTRRVIKELEDLGFIERIYAGSCKSIHSDPTFYVNWGRLTEPYREALRHADREASTRATLALQTGHSGPPLLISSQEYPEAGPSIIRNFEVVG